MVLLGVNSDIRVRLTRFKYRMLKHCSSIPDIAVYSDSIEFLKLIEHILLSTVEVVTIIRLTLENLGEIYPWDHKY